MGRYLSVDELKAYGFSTTVGDRIDYASGIDAAEQQIDNMLQRRIELADTLTARVFRPVPGSTVLWLDDFTTLASIVEDGTTLVENTDFVLEPLNGKTPAGGTRPYDRAVKVSGCWYTDGPKATVTVTAAWGWASIPPGAKEACKVLAKAFLDGRDIKSGIVALSEAGGVSEREAKALRDFVRDYRGARSWGIA